jgi:RNA polymerase sigma-70 factor (ECF subfamily)
MSLRRGRRAHRTTALELPEELACEDDGPDPLETREEARRAMEAMAQLSPDKRRVLELVLVSGLSHRAVAEATELPIGTVKSHARRGLRRLRELLEVPGEETDP